MTDPEASRFTFQVQPAQPPQALGFLPRTIQYTRENVSFSETCLPLWSLHYLFPQLLHTPAFPQRHSISHPRKVPGRNPPGPVSSPAGRGPKHLGRLTMSTPRFLSPEMWENMSTFLSVLHSITHSRHFCLRKMSSWSVFIIIVNFVHQQNTRFNMWRPFSWIVSFFLLLNSECLGQLPSSWQSLGVGCVMESLNIQ